jgi:hypothetical protein
MLEISLPARRSYPWRLLVVLAGLYLLGNLAGLPLLRVTDQPIEPVPYWAVATVVSTVVIALGLLLATRTALGAPLMEGELDDDEIAPWWRHGLALTTLLIVVTAPISLLANLNADPATYPFGWELLPASFKAGTVEEIGYRLLVVSALAWVGRLVKRNVDGRPKPAVYWMAIVLAGLVFGWAHVDARLGDPGGTIAMYALIMLTNSLLGIAFGWLFWRLGLEWAMFAHFAYDIFVSMALIPVYLLESPLVWSALILVLLTAATVSWRYLRRYRQISETVTH